MYCSYCGTENKDDAKYCRCCGYQLQQETNNLDFTDSNQYNQNQDDVYNYNDNYNNDYSSSYNQKENKGYYSDDSNNYVSNEYANGYNQNYNNYNRDYGSGNQGYPTKPPKKKSKAKVVIITVIVILLVLLAAAASLYFFVFKDTLGIGGNTSNTDTSISHVENNESTVPNTTVEDSSTSETATEQTSTTTGKSVTVPDLVDLDKNKAKSILQNKHLTCKIVEDYSDYKKDVVYDQSPSAGDTVSENSEVTIFVSKSGYSAEKLDDPDTYIIADSDIELVDEATLNSLPDEYVNLALNEIYARYGRKFNDKTIQEFFDNKNWYSGTIEPEDFKDSVFNDYERKNIDFIVEYMDKHNLR